MTEQLNAERALLGTLLSGYGPVDQVTEVLRKGTFGLPRHNLIYEAILQLDERGDPVDLVTVSDELGKMGTLAPAGGALYLTELTESRRSGSTLQKLARIVSEHALRKEISDFSVRFAQEAKDEFADTGGLMDRFERMSLALSERMRPSEIAEMRTLAVEQKARIIQGVMDPQSLQGIQSGYPSIDRMTNGWQRSDLIVVAARPSMGKTAFALSLAQNAASSGIACGILSLEMSAQQLTTRLIAAEARIEGHQVRGGRLSSEELQRVTDAADRVTRYPIHVVDNPSINPAELRSIARTMRRKGAEMILVDYIQLMNSTEGDNREQEVAYLSRTLKVLAKELDVPIIVLSQLNRGVEMRSDHRPRLSDLRESGSIEQDADVVIFLYRPSYYGIQANEEGPIDKNLAEIIVAKQRNGPTGSVHLAFVEEYARFENLIREDYTPIEHELPFRT